MNHPETILVLDFGSQYSQLIARRVRELHVYSKIVSWKISAEEIREMAPAGIILSGGPASVYQANAPKCDPAIFGLGIPVQIWRQRNLPCSFQHRGKGQV